MTFSCAVFAPRRTTVRLTGRNQRISPKSVYPLLRKTNGCCKFDLQQPQEVCGTCRKFAQSREGKGKKPCDVSFTPSFCLRDSLPTDPVKNKAERASFTFGTHLSGLLRSAINTQSRPYGHLRVLLLRRQALSCVLHLAYLIFDSGIVAHFLALCNSFFKKNRI